MKCFTVSEVLHIYRKNGNDRTSSLWEWLYLWRNPFFAT